MGGPCPGQVVASAAFSSRGFECSRTGPRARGSPVLPGGIPEWGGEARSLPPPKEPAPANPVEHPSDGREGSQRDKRNEKSPCHLIVLLCLGVVLIRLHDVPDSGWMLAVRGLDQGDQKGLFRVIRADPMESSALGREGEEYSQETDSEDQAE